MFKVKRLRSDEIIQVLNATCDEYGKTWFLIWENDGWRWRPANDFCPPNYKPKKKLIIAGSRDFSDFKLVRFVLDKEVNEIAEVVCGEAKGADTLGKTWAQYHNIPIKSFPADWQTYGSAAGYIRNHEMGDYADELIISTLKKSYDCNIFMKFDLSNFKKIKSENHHEFVINYYKRDKNA